MKTFSILALIAGLTALSSAQSLNPVLTFNWRMVNQISNPGFENATIAPWTREGSYRIDYYQYNYQKTDGVSYGYRRAGGHSGNACYDFGFQYLNYNSPYDLNSVVHQELATPLAGNAVWTASAWLYSYGQSVNVRINYTDGSYGYASTSVSGAYYPNNGQNGWIQWDFKSAIDSNKTVKSLDFSTYGAYNHPNNVLIDDVSLTKLVYVG